MRSFMLSKVLEKVIETELGESL